MSAAQIRDLQETVARQAGELAAEKSKAKEVIMHLKQEVEALLEGPSPSRPVGQPPKTGGGWARPQRRGAAQECSAPTPP